MKHRKFAWSVQPDHSLVVDMVRTKHGSFFLVQKERVMTVVKLEKTKDKVCGYYFRNSLREECSVQNQVELDIVDGDWKVFIEGLLK